MVDSTEHSPTADPDNESESVAKSPEEEDPPLQEEEPKSPPLQVKKKDRDADRDQRRRSRSSSPKRRRRDKKEGKRERSSPNPKEAEGGKRSKEESRRSKRNKEGSKEDRSSPKVENEKTQEEEWFEKKRTAPRLTDDLSKTKAGGAYIPPAKLRAMQAKIDDKSSEAYQRLSWDLLKKKILGKVNKVNVGNIQEIVYELLQENIIRGKGLLARSIIQAQAFSPAFSHVYAALVSVINSKFPHVGELVARRLVIQFKRAFKRNDKNAALTACKFIAHLVNHFVVHEILALEILTLLLENPTDDSVEIAVAFMKEAGVCLNDNSARVMNSIFERLRSILQDNSIDKRVSYMIEVLFEIRKGGFKDYQPVSKELDLLDDDDKITHTVLIEEAQDPENILNVFRFDPNFEETERKYEEIKAEILAEDSEDEDDDGGAEGPEDVDEEPKDARASEVIIDATETNLVAFRRTVYLTVQSSLDYQECAHKLLKLDIKPGLEPEMYNMFLDMCAQERTYVRFFGLLTERFCRLKKDCQQHFEWLFRETYSTIHRFDQKKLRNTASLFGHLLNTDSISWQVLDCVKLNEDDTTSHGRIFLKVLFQYLSEFMGVQKLYERLSDNTMQAAFDKLLPRDNPRDTRFAINFFTAIGLGHLTVGLREHLQSAPKPVPQEDSSSSSDSSESEDENERPRRKSSRTEPQRSVKREPVEDGSWKRMGGAVGGARILRASEIKQEPPSVRGNRPSLRPSPRRRRMSSGTPEKKRRRSSGTPEKKRRRSSGTPPEKRRRSRSNRERRPAGRDGKDAREHERDEDRRQRKALKYRK